MSIRYTQLVRVLACALAEGVNTIHDPISASGWSVGAICTLAHVLVGVMRSLKSSQRWGGHWMHWAPPILGMLIAYLWAGADIPITGVYPLAPLCSWRYVANFDSWNVALPDRSCVYHVMLMYMRQGDEFRLVSESLPYARYFSYQTYGFSHYKSDGALRDIDIVSENGPNAYRDLPAAVRGEKQGGYTIHITADGSGNHTNVLKAFGGQKKSGYFLLFFRIYDLGDEPHPEAPWAHRERGGVLPPEKWGWTPPPKVEVKRGPSAEWTEIPMCDDRRTTGYNLIDKVQDWLPVAHPTPGRIRANLKNNVYLPTVARRYGTFDNREARYLGAAADTVIVNSTSTSNMLWARIAANLPRVPGSLYEPPYISNTSGWDVRYVSLSSFSRALPLRSYDTLSDRDIRQHYAHVEDWDGRFTIWIGPKDAPVPQEATLERAIVMRWGEKQGGGVIKYPGFLYRQLLTRSQMEGGLEGGHHSGVANLIRDKCVNHDDESVSQEGDGTEEASLGVSADEACCGYDPPRYCHQPEFLHLRMREYYPQTAYYIANFDDKTSNGKLRLTPIKA